MPGKRGSPGNIGEPKSFQVTLPLDHYEYMTLIASMNRLGLTENDVAASILIRELDAMFKGGYHEKTFHKVKKPTEQSPTASDNPRSV
jgi:hypothetical protein